MSGEFKLPSYTTIFKRKFPVILAYVLLFRIGGKWLNAGDSSALFEWLQENWKMEGLVWLVVAIGLTASYSYDRWIDPPELRRIDRYVP